MAFGFFDGQKADASPESIKRKREMIARLMQAGRAPRDVGEGLHAIGQGLQAAVLGSRADAEEKANNASSAEAMRNIYSGFGAPMASAGNPVATGRATGSGATDDTYTGAPSGLFSSESGGRFTAQNNATGAGGMKGHFGRVQFGQARLQEAAAAGAIPQGTTPQQFMASPELQRAAERWHFADIDNRIKASGIVQKFGQTINGVPITRDGLVAVAHLGGIRGMQRFVETGGRYNPRDANGTSLMDYFARMGGQKQMASRMPVINPGPGAAPMPLARQQAQTAPMPNAGLADLPAPGSNQSASNVAPVQGDNPQQLLADADYYEQNGNVEAARQMRERAAMAGQPAPAAAFPLPEDGSQPNPLRDMFSARGVGFADNEAETQGFEARMAQDQAGAPAPDPSQVQTVAITPNAQNAEDVFSPIPMGIGPNPFVPRDAAPPSDVAAQGADPTAVSPRIVTAPMPPPRPADLRQQSPFVPPAMRAPLPVDMGGENSGGGAMQFIESEFARREGRPDPRSAIGAPQGYNPFVPQALQAPQMAAGGGSVQGASQSGAMAGGTAQAPAQANSRIAYLASVAGNSMNSAEVRQLAMTEIQAERARAQSEAERARVQAQNEAAADALGVDRRLAGNQPVFSAAAAAKLNNKTESIATTNAAREAEANRLKLTGDQRNAYILNGQLPTGATSTAQISNDTRAREVEAARIGLKPGDPRYQNFVLTGKMPREDAQPLSAGDKKAIMQAEDEVINFDNTISTLARAKELNPQAYSGFGAGMMGTIGTSGLPGTGMVFDQNKAKATREFNQLMSGQAIEQMAQTLKGATTDKEMGMFVEILGNPSTPPDIRARTIDRMMTLAQRQRDLAISRAKDLRGGDYFKPEEKRAPPSGATNAPAQGIKVLRYNPKTGALE